MVETPSKRAFMLNPSQSFTIAGEGFGEGFKRSKYRKYKGKLSLSINTSPVPRHTRVMCIRTREGWWGRIRGRISNSQCFNAEAENFNAARSIQSSFRSTATLPRRCDDKPIATTDATRLLRTWGPTIASASVAEIVWRVPHWQRRLGTPPGNDAGEG